MIGIFAFDGPMYQDINGVFCNMTVTEEMLQRYLVTVDKLYVLIRVEKINSTYQELHLSCIKDTRIEFIPLPNYLSGFKMFDRELKNTVKEMVRKADLFFLRLPSYICYLIGSECYRQNKKYLIENGGCSWDSYWNHSIKGKILAPYMFFHQRQCIARASFASYVTEKWLQKRYPCKCPAIVASNVYLPESDEQTLHNRINRIQSYGKNHCFIIGTSAKIDVRYKGQEYVIKALRILKDKGYNIKYELIGAGEPDFLLGVAKSAGVSELVEFKGILLHDEVLEWLDNVDIYAQPSKQEGLPRAMIEAMSRACPCIGSTTAGIPELIDNNLVFENGDVAAIAAIIEYLINNGFERYVKRNFDKSKEFNIDILNNRRNQLYLQYKNSLFSE